MNNTNLKFENLIAIDDLCQILKVKKSYIYVLTHEKRIPHYKIQGHLRFRLSEIEEWLKRRYVQVEKRINSIDF